MAEQGIMYEERAFDAPSAPRIYGLTSLDEAREFGYRGATSAEPDVSVPDDRFLEALLGDGEGLVQIHDETGVLAVEYDPDSCQATVMNEAMPGWERLYVLEPQLDAMVTMSAEISQESDAVRAAWERWSECMAGRGFDFETPVASYVSLWGGLEPLPDEIETAVADVECKSETGVLREWSTEVARLQELLIQQNPGVWEEWRDLRVGWLLRAEK